MDTSRVLGALMTDLFSANPSMVFLLVTGLLLSGVGLMVLTRALWGSGSLSGGHGTRRAIRREARGLMGQGAYLDAGRLYQRIGEYDQAIALYTQADAHRDLGQLFEHLKHWEAAAQAYEAAQEPERAALMLQRVGEWQRASELLTRAGKSLAAAEVFEKAGEYTSAASLYEESGHRKRAACLFERVEQWARAAELFEQEYYQEQRRRLDRGSHDQARDALDALALQAGRMWLRAGHPDRAATVFSHQKLVTEAVDAFVQAGSGHKAAELYLAQRQYDKAAMLFERLGDAVRRDMALAEQQLQVGEVRKAADLLAGSHQYLQAADLYERVAEHEQAAEMYAAAGDLKRAGEVYLTAGCVEKAAEALEQGLQFEDAARLYLKLDRLDRAAELFRKADALFEAGRIFHRMGRSDDAIEVLQRLDAQSEDYYDGSLVLGKIFLERGMLSAAKDRYQKLLTMKKDAPEADLEPLYHLATIYEREDDFEGARLLYEKILAQDFSYRDARERAAHVTQAQSSAPSGKPLGTGESPAVPRYKILKQIGQGGMGVVYRAEDTVLHRIVAYKVLPTSVREQPALLQNFLQEARIAASINHPNIVTIYDTGHDPTGEVFISMEFVDGMSLKELLDKVGALPLPQFLAIGKQICSGLGYAHGRRIIHRDIKPSNIMLSRDRMVKIMDFGLAKIVSDALADKTSVKGTPLYMAPEQILGKEVDHQSDLYSLGCTFYRMATGRLPFTKGDLYYHHLHSAPTPPKELNPKLPAMLNTLILRCLEKDKAKRYQRVADVLVDIEQFKQAA